MATAVSTSFHWTTDGTAWRGAEESTSENVSSISLTRPFYGSTLFGGGGTNWKVGLLNNINFDICGFLPKMLESRLETLQWGRNIVLIWGITKPFQQNEVPCYTCKEFRALKANVIFKVAYSLNIEQGTSFSEKVWWYLKSKLCCGPTVTFPI